MDALVSITDHDNIDGCLSLQVLEETRHVPVSIEWTVPFRGTFFHLGVHNLPPDTARAMTAAMNEFTLNPDEAGITPMLEWLGAARETLHYSEPPDLGRKPCRRSGTFGVRNRLHRGL